MNIKLIILIIVCIALLLIGYNIIAGRNRSKQDTMQKSASEKMMKGENDAMSPMPSKAMEKDTVQEDDGAMMEKDASPPGAMMEKGQ